MSHKRSSDSLDKDEFKKIKIDSKIPFTTSKFLKEKIHVGDKFV